MSFSELKDLLRTTDGNLSVHARKLEHAGYISCTKTFEGRLPRTDYTITAEGRAALERSREDAQTPPSALRPLSQSSEDADRRQRRVLRAHEVLASLSDENREQFRDVVEALREELAGYDGGDGEVDPSAGGAP